VIEPSNAGEGELRNEKALKHRVGELMVTSLPCIAGHVSSPGPDSSRAILRCVDDGPRVKVDRVDGVDLLLELDGHPLVVGVLKLDPAFSRCAGAGVACRLGSGSASQRDAADGRARVVVDYPRRVIRRTVVDDDDLGRRKALGDHGAETPFDRGTPIVDGNYDRNWRDTGPTMQVS
jgi:hypothetical protein